MLCDSPSNRSKAVLNEKKQLSFVYQPGVGLYDKKKRDSTDEQLPKSNLKRHNKQDSLPIRQESDEILSDKDASIDDNLTTNQENHQKRKLDLINHSQKKLRHSSTENLSNSIPVDQPTTLPIKSRTSSTDRSQKYSITPIIKPIPMVRKLSSENHSVPSQGLLLCPKEDPMKKKKKKKITSTSTEMLDDDSVLDSILFNEIQSVQQEWQQFLILTMEKELHINPSDGKKKLKPSKFNRSDEFLLAYENLYNFEGMKHWCPTSR